MRANLYAVLSEPTADNFDPSPMYLLIRGTGDLYGYGYVYERTFMGDILAWSGLLKNLNEEEYPIFAEISKEDLK